METWRSAHLKQARSDMVVFDSISRQPLCHQLHYLQMATEKLGKAFLAKDDKRPPQVHQTFVRFLRVCHDERSVCSIYRMSSSQLRQYAKKSLLDIAWRIENLVPKKDVEKPNPEYPWRESGRIIAPVDYPFLQRQLNAPKMAKLPHLVRSCLTLS